MIKFPVSPKKAIELSDLMSSVGLKESDLVESFAKGSGKGGQKINKSSICVMLIHKPTGLQVKCQQERSQALNRFFARRFLAQKLADSLGIITPKNLLQAKQEKQKSRRKRRGKVAHSEGAENE